MILLSSEFNPAAPRPVVPLRRTWILSGAVVFTAVAASLASETALAGRDGLGRDVASGVVHGGFLVSGWVLISDRAALSGPVVCAAVGVLLASVAAWLSPWGAVLYLLPPIFLVRGGRRCETLRRAGVDTTAGGPYLVAGLAAGTFLGGHLLVAASLTFGHPINVPALETYMAAVAYDVGANALTAEWLFRGALFSVSWRRREFWPAASLSTALAVCRYVLDPALPLALEVRAGAVFYMVLVGFTGCALRAASGSLLPGYLATLTFFAAYRMLGR
jgi:hypothetical protein